MKKIMFAAIAVAAVTGGAFGYSYENKPQQSSVTSANIEALSDNEGESDCTCIPELGSVCINPDGTILYDHSLEGDCD